MLVLPLAVAGFRCGAPHADLVPRQVEVPQGTALTSTMTAQARPFDNEFSHVVTHDGGLPTASDFEERATTGTSASQHCRRALKPVGCRSYV